MANGRSDMPMIDLTYVPDVTEEQAQAAQRTVRSRVADENAVREILEALGIVARSGRER